MKAIVQQVLEEGFPRDGWRKIYYDTTPHVVKCILESVSTSVNDDITLLCWKILYLWESIYRTCRAAHYNFVGSFILVIASASIIPSSITSALSSSPASYLLIADAVPLSSVPANPIFCGSVAIVRDTDADAVIANLLFTRAMMMSVDNIFHVLFTQICSTPCSFFLLVLREIVVHNWVFNRY